MKLGPLQKKWVEALKAHPERQGKGKLGYIQNGKKKMCCLGQAGLIIGSCKWINGKLTETESGSEAILSNSYDLLGLHAEEGRLLDGTQSLVSLNDYIYHTWTEIAYLIEAVPELFFTQSI